MAKNIKDIVDRINFLAGKYQEGYFTPETIVEEVNRQSYAMYTDLIDVYSRTRRISDFLSPFMKTASLTFTSGTANKPADFEHHRAMYNENTTIEVLGDEYQIRKAHVNKAPTADYPIARYLATTITILPTTITSATLDYFKLPVKAVYAYTTSGDDYVYNDSSSVALEWTEQMLNKITLGTISKLGIPVNDRDLVQFGLIQESKPPVTK